MRPECLGFTLLEILLIVAILAILAALAVPAYEDALLEAREIRAIAELRQFDKDILTYELRNGALPPTLDDSRPDPPLDPWGSPYRYYLFPQGAKKIPGARADKNLRPVNTRYDLYSAGADGLTKLQFTAKQSRDDIVRAADGAFFGRAEDY